MLKALPKSVLYAILFALLAQVHQYARVVKVFMEWLTF